MYARTISSLVYFGIYSKARKKSLYKFSYYFFYCFWITSVSQDTGAGHEQFSSIDLKSKKKNGMRWLNRMKNEIFDLRPDDYWFRLSFDVKFCNIFYHLIKFSSIDVILMWMLISIIKIIEFKDFYTFEKIHFKLHMYVCDLSVLIQFWNCIKQNNVIKIKRIISI